MNKPAPWKVKVQDLFNCCHVELKKTTDIGKKMLTASKTNSCLHDAHEELGGLVVSAIKKGELKWDHPRVRELLQTIESCENNLQEIETEVQKIKFSAGPQDISTKE